MRLCAVLAGFLLLSASCNGRSARTGVQGLPVDQRYGLARLDSAFALNDPYAGFNRPAAPVSETPPEVRSRFQKDLEALFGSDPTMRAQLDSGQEIIIFTQQLGNDLQSYVLHVSDMIAGDRYFLYLKRGGQISEKPWTWYGPAAGPAEALHIKDVPLVALQESGPMLAINEWRHNGNVYTAWVRTLLAVGTDLSLRPEFRFEAFSISPGEGDPLVIHRDAKYIAANGRYEVYAAIDSGRTRSKIGYVTLARTGAAWTITERSVSAKMKKYEKLVWSANPLGEDAIFNNLPPEASE